MGPLQMDHMAILGCRGSCSQREGRRSRTAFIRETTSKCIYGGVRTMMWLKHEENMHLALTPHTNLGVLQESSPLYEAGRDAICVPLGTHSICTSREKAFKKDIIRCTPGSTHDGYSNEQRRKWRRGGYACGIETGIEREPALFPKKRRRHGIEKRVPGGASAFGGAGSRGRNKERGGRRYRWYGKKARRRSRGCARRLMCTVLADNSRRGRKRVGRTGRIGVEESGARIQNCVGEAGFMWRWPMREGTRGKEERNVVRRQKAQTGGGAVRRYPAHCAHGPDGEGGESGLFVLLGRMVDACAGRGKRGE
ncbi:hypothetical protein B0H13DRAFT_2274156 [Mycena leptocephala]|nr:hypothetical protein B0H13DRAFT_2274156 [Mycena leptocephala]